MTETASNPWPLRGFAAGLIIVCLVGAWHLREQGAAIEQLQADVLALQQPAHEEAAQAAEPAPPPPNPQPRRASAPRAAQRPADPPAAPAAEPVRWGTTDLDRAIAAHPPVLTHLETSK